MMNPRAPDPPARDRAGLDVRGESGLVELAVREGAVAAVSAPGVVVLSVAGGQALLSVGSGSYRFTSS